MKFVISNKIFGKYSDVVIGIVKKLSIGSTDFASIKRRKGGKIKPHAHVIDGKNILSNGEVLEFE